MVGEAGLLAEQGNAASLAECMSKVIKNPALIALYGQKAGTARPGYSSSEL